MGMSEFISARPASGMGPELGQGTPGERLGLAEPSPETLNMSPLARSSTGSPHIGGSREPHLTPSSFVLSAGSKL